MTQSNTQIPSHIKAITEQLKDTIAMHQKQIEVHQRAIGDLEFTIKMWLEHQPKPVQVSKMDSPLTREVLRNLMRGYKRPIQTVQVINILYKNKGDEEKHRLTKTLSVMFNQMTKEGEINVEKKPGIKGSFYKLKD